VGTGATLAYESLPTGAVYLRAEVLDDMGSIVFTQPFVLRHVDDANGDGRLDANDDADCTAVADGLEDDPDLVAACTGSP
jgi:hypothetical protein